MLMFRPRGRRLRETAESCPEKWTGNCGASEKGGELKCSCSALVNTHKCVSLPGIKAANTPGNNTPKTSVQLSFVAEAQISTKLDRVSSIEAQRKTKESNQMHGRDGGQLIQFYFMIERSVGSRSKTKLYHTQLSLDFTWLARYDWKSVAMEILLKLNLILSPSVRCSMKKENQVTAKIKERRWERISTRDETKWLH